MSKKLCYLGLGLIMLGLASCQNQGNMPQQRMHKSQKMEKTDGCCKEDCGSCESSCNSCEPCESSCGSCGCP